MAHELLLNPTIRSPCPSETGCEISSGKRRARAVLLGGNEMTNDNASPLAEGHSLLRSLGADWMNLRKTGTNSQ